MIVGVGAAIAALYFGSEVFVPVALAILLSFVLAPGVKLLRRAHFGRVPAVGVMTLLAFLVIFALTALMASQFRDLTSDLPRYQSTIAQKLDSLKSLTNSGALKRLSETLASFSREAVPAAPNPAAPAATATGHEPMPVTIRQPDPTPIETLSSLLRPLLHPLATGGIVVVFVIFILLQREDLRNRLIRLVGAGDIHRSTAALDDAARRLSGYLLSQLAINTASGIAVALALWLIGIPSPLLCGILFGCLRFVPYVGPPLAAVIPILLAAAVSPGWSMALWTVALFACIEFLVGQVIEPLLYGHNTGLSPVAVVVAATFWTALWGPIGLLLSTPMTVCLVVLGRHVERLQFLDLLLGDRPPLTPPEIFYQRMLANDPVEAAEHARQALRDDGLNAYYDGVVMPGLLLAQADAVQGRLDPDRQARIARATAELVEDLADEDLEPNSSRGGPARRLVDRLSHREGSGAEAADVGVHDETAILEMAPAPALDPEWAVPGAVLCIGSRGPLDDAAAMLLAQLLQKHGFGAQEASFETLLKANIDRADLSGTKLVVLSCLDGSSLAYLRFLHRRLRRKAPSAAILVGAWWQAVDAEGPMPEGDAAGRRVGDGWAATLPEAVAFCVGRASADGATEHAGADPRDRAIGAAS